MKINSEKIERILENYINGNRKDASMQFKKLRNYEKAFFISFSKEMIGDYETNNMLEIIYNLMQ